MKVFTPATSANLGPGFDCLGLAIKLYNEVEIIEGKFSAVSIFGHGSDKIHLKKSNSFVTIFNEIYDELGAPKSNFKFNFTNNIPFSRGLGSSSSVIVGAIAAAYKVAEFTPERRAILNKAIKYENHPDNIAPAVFGGFTSSVVNNGEVFTHKFNLDPNLRCVIVIPNETMNTKQSRARLPQNYKMSDVVSNVSHAAFLTACFAKGDYDLLREACIDKMHEDTRMSLLPALFDLRRVAYENGALMSTLSGSGSSFFNMIFKADAPRLKEILSKKFPNFAVEIYEFDDHGFSFES